MRKSGGDIASEHYPDPSREEALRALGAVRLPGEMAFTGDEARRAIRWARKLDKAKDRWLKIGIGVGVLGSGLVVAIVWMILNR